MLTSIHGLLLRVSQNLSLLLNLRLRKSMALPRSLLRSVLMPVLRPKLRLKPPGRGVLLLADVLQKRSLMPRPRNSLRKR